MLLYVQVFVSHPLKSLRTGALGNKLGLRYNILKPCWNSPLSRIIISCPVY